MQVAWLFRFYSSFGVGNGDGSACSTAAKGIRQIVSHHWQVAVRVG